VKEEPKIQIPQEPEIYKIYDVILTKEVQTIPAVVYPQDKELYKTITIKNVGILDFPAGAYIRHLTDKQSQKVLLPTLEVNKEYNAVLRIKSAQKPGKYTSSWVVAFKNENGEEELIGKPIIFLCEVSEKIPADVLSKAKTLHELFPEKDINFFVECVKTAGNCTVEELIENFLAKQ